METNQLNKPVSLRYREITTMVKTVTFCKLKLLAKKQEKEAGTNFNFLSQPRNIIGQFIKTYLHRPIKILKFPQPARFQECLT